MIYWDEYYGHVPNLIGTTKKFDNTIYTFDIETSSYLILNGKQIPAIDYLKLTKEQQDNSIFMSNMYIWMFGINDTIYYGRTFRELYLFLQRIEMYATSNKKYCYVHNLSYEFQFLRNAFYFENVFSRKSRKVMKCTLQDFNFEFRCTLYMTNCKLEKLPKVFNLSVEKMVGDLDYSLIRNSMTILSEKELQYCENDCLVVYQYILRELETYGTLPKIPLTSTGHVRKELKDKTRKDYKYKSLIKKSVNVEPHVYNLLISAFAGGYTHANWIFADNIVKNVVSYDETSAYPFVMVAEKYPSTKFRKINLKSFDKMKQQFAYILNVKFYNIKSKYINNFISKSKCVSILKGKYDNGRIIKAEELEIVITDIDLKIILESYDFSRYEIKESYFSLYEYLPKQFVEFILEKYKNKTEFKGVKGKEVEYNLEKAKFNSLFGMCVTNNISDKVIYDNETGWTEKEISNEEIQELLFKEEKMGFLSFSYGVWITAYARYNLITNIIKQDKFCIYADTDSMKLREGFNLEKIKKYNESVMKKLEDSSKYYEIPLENYMPKDKKGKSHPLGLFEFDGKYDEFITQGAKKYAYIDSEDKEIHITVSGVPKKGAKALKSLEEFRDNFIFKYEDTGKNMMMYNDEMEPFELEDYQGNKEIQRFKYGAILVPTTYELGKAEEYFDLISDDSTKRAIFKEV